MRHDTTSGRAVKSRIGGPPGRIIGPTRFVFEFAREFQQAIPGQL